MVAVAAVVVVAFVSIYAKCVLFENLLGVTSKCKWHTQRFNSVRWYGSNTLCSHVCMCSCAEKSLEVWAHVLQCNAIHCLVPFFFAWNPIVPLFQCCPVLCCFRKHLLLANMRFFSCDVVYFFRAHLSYNLFFPAHSASSSNTHFMCLCNIMNGCTLHLVLPPTLNSLSLSPPHFVCGWINLLVAKPAENGCKNGECSVKAHQQREQNSANTTYVTSAYSQRIRIERGEKKASAANRIIWRKISMLCQQQPTLPDSRELIQLAEKHYTN